MYFIAYLGPNILVPALGDRMTILCTKNNANSLDYLIAIELSKAAKSGQMITKKTHSYSYPQMDNSGHPSIFIII